MALVKRVYEVTRTFPREEIYGLTAQMRRSAVSIPSNLAEGAARTGRKEFAQFLSIAKGSLSELETQLLISADLGYLDKNHEIFQSVEEVSRLLAGLHRSVTN
jgi:four helix bundle protein